MAGLLSKVKTKRLGESMIKCVITDSTLKRGEKISVSTPEWEESGLRETLPVGLQGEPGEVI